MSERISLLWALRDYLIDKGLVVALRGKKSCILLKLRNLSHLVLELRYQTSSSSPTGSKECADVNFGCVGERASHCINGLLDNVLAFIRSGLFNLCGFIGILRLDVKKVLLVSGCSVLDCRVVIILSRSHSIVVFLVNVSNALIEGFVSVCDGIITRSSSGIHLCLTISKNRVHLIL